MLIPQGHPLTVRVHDGTVYTRAGAPASLGDLRPGVELRVQGTSSGRDVVTAARVVIAGAPAPQAGRERQLRG